MIQTVRRRLAVTRRTSSSSTRNTPSFRDTEGSSITAGSVPVTTLLSKQRAAAECEGKTCPCFVAGDRRLQVLAGGQVAGSSSHLRLLVTSYPHRRSWAAPYNLTVVTIIFYKVCVF